MKYIRTKDGLFEIRVLELYKGSDNKYDYFIGCKNSETDISGFYRKNEIRLANIIEELCDCYSYDTETTKDYIVARSWKFADKSRKIYGCIKNDKGLIYVAKLNEKGDLELL